jgi:uncharacterized membrane protein
MLKEIDWTAITILFTGITAGVFIGCGVALWVFVALTKGNEHPLSKDEITERIKHEKNS